MRKDHPQPRTVMQPDAMQGAFLGPEFSDAEIESVLQQHGAVYQRLPQDEMLDRVTDLLTREKIVGWVQGRMEFGPRVLGHRSILGDPRSPKMQSVLNLKVKFRESFRPFAPAVLEERAAEYFELDCASPYMLLVAPVHPGQRVASATNATGLDRLKQIRSHIPAVTHVDYSARVQTISAVQNPLFHALLRRFEQKTGCPVLVNTSFNVRGEPVVFTPDDAYRCFVNTEMDYLAIGSFLLERTVQPARGVKPSFHPVPD
jgi:carbamoyltransferase